jgi:uncharacterized protein (TIGR00297 family)
MDLLIGFLLGVIVGGVAWRARALTKSGVLAAILSGGLIFGLGGLPWAVLLLTFFISSSALSRVFVQRKAELSEKFSKGSRRDWGQVLANGGLGTILVLFHAIWPGVDWPWIAYAGAIAAVTADTWATELGVLSPTQPRLITTGRRVEDGTSGGVTLLGTLGALFGAVLIGVVAAGFSPTLPPLLLVLVVAVTGLAGSFVDSLLGATVQAIYHCPSCDKETERHPLHTCGSQTIKIRGWRWINNDLVNFICSITGAIVGVGGGLLII